MFPLPEAVKEHFKKYRNFQDAWNAVKGGYAKIQVADNKKFRDIQDSWKAVNDGHAKLQVGANKKYQNYQDALRAMTEEYAKIQMDDKSFEPALIVSKELEKRFRSSSPYHVLIEKYAKTWAGKSGAVSKTVESFIQKATKNSKIDAGDQFDKKYDPVTLQHLVCCSVIERNSKDTRSFDGNRDRWNFLLDRKANGSRHGAGAKLPKNTSTNASREPVELNYVDTMHFNTDVGKSLKSFGSLIGIEKDELTEAQMNEIEELSKSDPLKFYKYGIIDSIITAETLAFFWRIFWLDLGTSRSTRVTEYSSKVFRKIFREEVYGELISEAKNAREKREKNLKMEITPDDFDPSDPEFGNRDAAENMKYYLGWEKRKGRNGKPNYWWPSAKMQLFSSYYYGGRNDAHVVGPTGECTYYDLKSAYPCAGLMLSSDYNFREPIEKHNSDAQEFVARLYEEDDPFQIVGIDLAFSFRPGVEPIFPAKFDRNNIPSLSLLEASDTLLFIRSGFAQVMWPELYVALKHDMLESYTINRILTYKPLEGSSKFAKHIEEFLIKRGEVGKKMLMKELLNFIYGLTGMGITRRITTISDQLAESKTKPGGLTCFPISAYCTSVCRAVMGELLATRNPCYAITTDGYISPKMNGLDFEKCEIATRTHNKLRAMKNEAGESLGYEYIEADFKADRALFIKTRGYLLVNEEGVKSNLAVADPSQQQELSTDPTDSPKPKKREKSIKMAKMGIQTESRKELKDGERAIEEAKDFLKILNRKMYPKNSWPSFSTLKKDGKNDLPLPTVRMSSCNHTYDMKRVPCKPFETKTFEFQEVSFSIPSFETRPLNDISEFIKLRHDMSPNQSVEDYLKLLKKYL